MTLARMYLLIWLAVTLGIAAAAYMMGLPLAAIALGVVLSLGGGFWIASSGRPRFPGQPRSDPEIAKRTERAASGSDTAGPT